MLDLRFTMQLSLQLRSFVMSALRLNRRQALQGLAAIGLAATGGLPSAADAAVSKVLRARSYSDLQVLDPLDWISQPDVDIAVCCLSKLIRHKPGTSWDWELDAAESIKQIDDTHVAFTLRKGIKWSNGFGELTAEDVKYSFERIANPKNQSPYMTDWSSLDHVEVTDSYSGVIVLKEYFAPLWTSTLPEASGMIVCKKAVEALPGKKFTTAFPAVSGPYQIGQWVPKQKTVLTRNPDFSGTPPIFDSIEIYPIEDPNTAEIAFEAGSLDFTWIGLDALARLKKKAPANAVLIERPSLAFTWLGMNLTHPNLQDVNVRRAIQQAVDMDSVLEAAYFGQAQRATGIVAPSLLGHRTKNLYGYDPNAAKASLEKAGKSEGLRVTLACLNTSEFLSAAQVIQASLSEVGITADIKPYDSGTFWTLGSQTGTSWKEIQLILNRYTMEPDPSWATAWFTTAQIGVWNWERWSSPEFDKLQEKALHMRDSKERNATYQHMQNLMEESGAYLFITNGATPSITRDNVVPALLPDGVPLLFAFGNA
jgi:peptide/nickel transport system substrate-binding protein